jgi:ribosomal protein S18 acetylase RimI-like enzyme
MVTINPDLSRWIPIYTAGRQLAKVRFILVLALLCAAGGLWWGQDLARHYGLSPGDGGVLAPLPERLAWGGVVAMLGLAFAAGMVIYSRIYITRILYDERSRRLNIETAGLIRPVSYEFPISAVGGSKYYTGKLGDNSLGLDLGTARVNAPWFSVQVAGRSLPFLLDQQGDFLEPLLLDQLLLKEITVREAAEEEVEDLVDLIHSAFEEYYGRLDPPSGAHAEDEASLLAKLRRGGAYIAFKNSEPAGCVLYQPEADHVYMERLSVLPAYRGRGIGRALVEAVEAHARRLGLPCVRLGVRAEPVENRDYYQRLGYQVQREMAHAGYDRLTYYVYEKVF